jgi:hypothetical protein
LLRSVSLGLIKEQEKLGTGGKLTGGKLL